MRRRTRALAALGSWALASGSIACARVWGFDDLTLAASTDGGLGDGTTIHDSAVEARTDGGMPACASDAACAAACDGGASCAGWTVQAYPVRADPGGTNNYNAGWGSGPGDVNTVWGSSSTDVYVAGTGVILRGP